MTDLIDGTGNQLEKQGKGSVPPAPAKAKDNYQLGRERLRKWIDAADDHDRPLFTDWHVPVVLPQPDTGKIRRAFQWAWKIVLERFNSPWFPLAFVIVTTVGAFGLCSWWPSLRSHVVLLLEAGGVLLLLISTIIYGSELIAHAKSGALANRAITASPTNTSAGIAAWLTFRIYSLVILAGALLLAVIFCFTTHALMDIRGDALAKTAAQSRDAVTTEQEPLQADMFDLSAAQSWWYLGYLLFLTALFATFSRLDVIFARHSSKQKQTVDYSILFGVCDFPSFCAFLMLVLLVVVSNALTRWLQEPVALRMSVIGGAATMQMYIACIVFGSVTSGGVLKRLVTNFGNVSDPPTS